MNSLSPHQSASAVDLAISRAAIVALAGGNLRVLGIGAVANLCLVFGSLMFLRNTRYFHGEATAHRRAIQDAEVEGR